MRAIQEIERDLLMSAVKVSRPGFVVRASGRRASEHNYNFFFLF